MLSNRTIARLLGLDALPRFDLGSATLRVTFRPAATPGSDSLLEQFARELEATLAAAGVQIVPWGLAIDGDSGRRAGRALLRNDLDAVVDLGEGHGFENHVVHLVPDKLSLQIISLRRIEPQLADPELPYESRIGLGLAALADALAPIVIGVSESQISIVNMNLSDTIVDRRELSRFVERSLLPKIAAPIRPLALEPEHYGYYRPDTDPHVRALCQMAVALAPSGLFPQGSRIRQQLGPRADHPAVKRLIEEITEGRTGVSYGFMAMAAAPAAAVHARKREVAAHAWSAHYPIRGCPEDELRQTSEGRWLIRAGDRRESFVTELPDVRVYSSRSGAPDKTRLDPARDVLRLSLSRGKLRCERSQHVEPGEDAFASFDSRVILAIALASALYAPALASQPMPIVHFHGYPHPVWFEADEHFGGERNAAYACGTAEAAVLAFLEMAALATRHPDLRLACIVEPGHGCNLVARSASSLVKRLNEGASPRRGKPLLALGGAFLGDLVG